MCGSFLWEYFLGCLSTRDLRPLENRHVEGLQEKKVAPGVKAWDLVIEKSVKKQLSVLAGNVLMCSNQKETIIYVPMIWMSSYLGKKIWIVQNKKIFLHPFVHFKKLWYLSNFFLA